MATKDLVKYLVFALYLFFNLLVVDGNSHLYAVSPGNSTQIDIGYEYSIDSLFIALLSNGDASIDYNLVIDSKKPTANITLFGKTVQNLTLTDYNGTSIQYFTTERPEKIIVDTQSSVNIHVTYTTPDFVDKQNRNWTFSFFFDDRFLLKMPREARIIVMEPQPYLTPTYEQDLWGFGPGDVEVKYVIGPLGTKEEAQAAIRFIEETIEETKTNSKGIIMTNITSLIQQTKSFFKEGKYLEAVNYAAMVGALVENITNSYVVGQQTISQAETDLQNKKDSGYDTSNAEKLLANAKSLFSQGHYNNASIVAKLAISQSIPQHDSFVSSLNLGIIVSIILGIIATIFFLFKRRTQLFSRVNVKNSLFEEKANKLDNSATIGNPETPSSSQETNSRSNKSGIVSSMPVNVLPSSPDEAEIKDYLNQVVEEVNNVRTSAFEDKINGSGVRSLTPFFASIDKDQMAQQVAQMKVKKPYLRLEDKELLDFLVEKNGSAFESEVRTKFVLPRTSLWRLVKRLEREELLEVRKIGGQNLISLKFEKTKN